MSMGIARIADGEPRERKRRDGRALLLNGARQLLAEKGYAGMELRDVAERGRAPRGSIYHHFPGGKTSWRARRRSWRGRRSAT
jgi:TetR/AcrR family transcriptional repressor of lmrAB and yxaGH operons